MARRPAPSSWPPSALPTRRLLQPLERFLHVEAASGIVLLIAAAAALLWANSPWAASYQHLWHAPLTLGLGALVVAEPLHFWINDGLMTIFFLVVGLEIRREIHEGALESLRLAALPVAAALGGVLAPAAIYLAVNGADPALRLGWAVPTATDIAFAVGVLALLGRRVPAPVRVLLLALAIIDDIAAVLVIAFFYSSGVTFAGLALVLAGVLMVYLFQRFGFRSAWAYVLPGLIVWLGMLRAGVHPSIAGVLVGLLTPVTHAFSNENPLAIAARALEEFRDSVRRGTRDADSLLTPLRDLRVAQLDMLPPVMRVQAALHPWVAFGIMPLFALANAGVSLEGLALDQEAVAAVVAGITGGLVIGKPLGILLATALGVRLGLCALPAGVGWGGIATLGCLAGIGFTMAIFIANLAFADAALLAAAKFAVLIASATAAAVGLVVGRVVLRERAAEPPTAPPTMRSAEGAPHD